MGIQKEDRMLKWLPMGGRLVFESIAVRVSYTFIVRKSIKF